MGDSICAECGHSNRAGARVCAECGTALETILVEPAGARAWRVTAPAPSTAIGSGWAAIGNPELEAFYARYAELWEARDIDALVAMYSPEYVMVDNRTSGRGKRGGRELAEENSRATMDSSPDVRFRIDEVLATVPGVIAMRACFCGHDADTGGALEIALGYVSTIRRGFVVRTELFDPEDEVAIRACFADLLGRTLLGDHASESLQLRWIDCYGRRDESGLRELIGDESRLLDHRATSCDEQRGRDAFIDLARSSWRQWPDIRMAIDEVIAVDEHTIAVRATYRGSSDDGGGPMELPTAYVCSFGETGFREVHQFDHGDTEAILACYRRLG